MKYKVFGPNSVNGELTCWHFPNLEDAKTFAATICSETTGEYLVCQLLGTCKPVPCLTQYVDETDAEVVNCVHCGTGKRYWAEKDGIPYKCFQCGKDPLK